MESVVTVTVTYNDACFLTKCVSALKKQTLQVDKIIIVDNNSDEDNKAIINELKSSNVDIIHLAENLGGAGGFEKGMEYAQKKYAPDWYWIMDADAYPRPDCLENLLKHKDDIEHIGYLAPLIYGVDLQQYQLYHHKKLTRFLERDLPLYHSYEEIPEISVIEADAFVGPLFSKEAIETVGIVDGGLFIYGDDLEYTYRVTRKFPALLVRDAVINHRDQPAANGKFQPQNWWKDYYMYRNRLLFIDEFQKNNLYKKTGKFLVFLRIVKQRIINLKENSGELRRIRSDLLKKSYIDGLQCKKEKIIDPTLFRSMVNEL